MENNYENRVGFFSQCYIGFSDKYICYLTENFKVHETNKNNPKYKILVIEKSNNNIISMNKSFTEIGLYSKVNDKTQEKYYYGYNENYMFFLKLNEEKQKENPKLPKYNLDIKLKTNDYIKSNNTQQITNSIEIVNNDYDEVPF